jgi:DnaJ-class molecular chaperone
VKTCPLCKGSGVHPTMGDVVLGILLIPFTVGLSVPASLNATCNRCKGKGVVEE